MKKSLDLGCGINPKNPLNIEEVYGIDIRENIEKNIKMADLAIEPIPFDDGFFDCVTAFDFIEHIPRLIYAPSRRFCFVELMNEIHRVLKLNGLFLSSTPAFPHGSAWQDPTHVNIITEHTFPCYFDNVNRWASIYGFNGYFKIEEQVWDGAHLRVAMRKVMPDPSQKTTYPN